MFQGNQRFAHSRLADSEALGYSRFHDTVARVEISAHDQVAQHVGNLIGDRYFPPKRDGKLLKLDGERLAELVFMMSSVFSMDLGSDLEIIIVAPILGSRMISIICASGGKAVIHRIAPALALMTSSFLWGADVDESRSEMRASIERYTADRASLSRVYTIDRSVGGASEWRSLYREWLEGLPKLNFDAMSQDGRSTIMLFRNHLQHELRQLELQTKLEGATAPLTPFAQTIIGLEESRRRMEPLDAAKAAAVLNTLAKTGGCCAAVPRSNAEFRRREEDR